LLSWATSGNVTAPVEIPVVASVPLPATGWLLLVGLIGLAANRRKIG
jgi:hypothetical protein